MKIIGKSITCFNSNAQAKNIAVAGCNNYTSNTYQTYTIHFVDTFYAENNSNILTIKHPGPYSFRAPYLINQNGSGTTVKAQYRVLLNGSTKVSPTAATRDSGGTTYSLGNLKIGDTIYTQIRPVDTGTTVVGLIWFFYNPT